MTIQPLRAVLVIEEAKASEQTTASGIVLPGVSNTKKTETGVVVAAGPEATIKVGDTIIFNRYGAEQMELEGKNYLFLDESDVLGTMPN